jgi:hypothetical protein
MTNVLASENEFPIIRILEDPTPPTTPPTGVYYVFVDEGTKTLHGIDDAGLETDYAPGAPAAHAIDHELGGADVLEVSDLATSESDDTLVLAPDGAGGVEWRAEAGGSSVTALSAAGTTNTAIANGSWTDLLSLSLTAGTWIAWASCPILSAGTGNAYLRIVDSTGTIVWGETAGTLSGAMYMPFHVVTPAKVIAGAITLKLQGQRNVAAVHTAIADVIGADVGMNLTALKIA